MAQLGPNRNFQLGSNMSRGHGGAPNDFMKFGIGRQNPNGNIYRHPQDSLSKFPKKNPKLSMSSSHSGTSTSARGSASKSDNDFNLDQILIDMRISLDICNRVYHFRTYKQCFVGREFVTWLIKHKYAMNRSEAANLGRHLLEMKIIEHVCREHHFKDSYFFYRIVPLTRSQTPKHRRKNTLSNKSYNKDKTIKDETIDNKPKYSYNTYSNVETGNGNGSGNRNDSGNLSRDACDSHLHSQGNSQWQANSQAQQSLSSIGGSSSSGSSIGIGIGVGGGVDDLSTLSCSASSLSTSAANNVARLKIMDNSKYMRHNNRYNPSPDYLQYLSHMTKKLDKEENAKHNGNENDNENEGNDDSGDEQDEDRKSKHENDGSHNDRQQNEHDQMMALMDILNPENYDLVAINNIEKERISNEVNNQSKLDQGDQDIFNLSIYSSQYFA